MTMYMYMQQVLIALQEKIGKHIPLVAQGRELEEEVCVCVCL